MARSERRCFRKRPSQRRVQAYQCRWANHVYYSTIFTPFKEQVQKLTGESAVLSPLFRTAYEIWIGYHAILQEKSRAENAVNLEPEQMDMVFETERCRVATMQVKQAARSADVVFRLSRQAAN